LVDLIRLATIEVMTIRFLPGVTLGRQVIRFSWNERKVGVAPKFRVSKGCFYFYKARKDLLYFIALLTYPTIPRSQLISTFGVGGIGNITVVLNYYGSFLGCPLCQRRNQNSFCMEKESALKGFENILLGLLYE